MRADLDALAAADDGIVLVRRAAALGYGPRALERSVRDGLLHRVRRGAYVDAATWAGADGRERHRLLVQATLMQSRRPGVLSHWSAAAWWGLDVLGPWPSEVHVTTSSGAGPSGVVRRHARPLDPASVTAHHGRLVTIPARTAVDLACAVGFRGGVVACDSVLRSGRASLGDLVREGELAARPGGDGTGLRAARFADAAAESVGESVSRVVLHEVGLPPPQLQARFADRDGVLARVDFWWRAHRTVGEFDGRVKYRGSEGARRPEDVVWAEKLREDRLRSLGLEVVRWAWGTLDRPEELQARVLAAFGRSRR